MENREVLIDDCAEQFVKKKKIKCLEYTEALKTFMKLSKM